VRLGPRRASWLWLLVILPLPLPLPLLPSSIAAQGRDDQFYFPGRFNWTFLRTYPEAARLFNGFDYGHAVLYELLLENPDGPVAELEEKQFNYLTRDLLRNPPRFSVAEEAIQPGYSRMAWRAKQMFDWAHTLHRQIYDVHSDQRLSSDQQHATVERLIDYYLQNERLAFAARPKAMELMDGQPFSQVFRRRYPKFNGLIWGYHWLQVGLYESLLLEPDVEARRDGIRESLGRFWEMVAGAPSTLPQVMPMTSAVAPAFSRRHPRAAVIFDNLHMLHDIISDILVSDEIAPRRKAVAIEEAAAEFRDGDRNVVDMEHWWMMGDHMGGVDRMGGVAGRRRPGRPPNDDSLAASAHLRGDPGGVPRVDLRRRGGQDLGLLVGVDLANPAHQALAGRPGGLRDAKPFRGGLEVPLPPVRAGDRPEHLRARRQALGDELIGQLARGRFGADRRGDLNEIPHPY